MMDRSSERICSAVVDVLVHISKVVGQLFISWLKDRLHVSSSRHKSSTAAAKDARKRKYLLIMWEKVSGHSTADEGRFCRNQRPRIGLVENYLRILILFWMTL